jgi:hypothetical protein
MGIQPAQEMRGSCPGCSRTAQAEGLSEDEVLDMLKEGGNPQGPGPGECPGPPPAGRPPEEAGSSRDDASGWGHQEIRRFRDDLRLRGFRKVTCFMILTLTCICPALVSAGYLAPAEVIAPIGEAGLIAIAAIGGAVALALYYPDLRYCHLGVIPGLVSGPLVFWCVRAYAHLRPDHLTKLELVIPVVISAGPGVAIWLRTLQSRVLRDGRLRPKPHPHAHV